MVITIRAATAAEVNSPKPKAQPKVPTDTSYCLEGSAQKARRCLWCLGNCARPGEHGFGSRLHLAVQDVEDERGDACCVKLEVKGCSNGVGLQAIDAGLLSQGEAAGVTDAVGVFVGQLHVAEHLVGQRDVVEQRSCAQLFGSTTPAAAGGLGMCGWVDVSSWFCQGQEKLQAHSKHHLLAVGCT